MIFGLMGSAAGLASMAFSILFLVQIFKTSGPVWGILSLLFGLPGLIWLFQNWQDGKGPFLKSFGLGVLSVVFSGVGVFLST